jgi:Xaa-Pro aminopeptidase
MNREKKIQLGISRLKNDKKSCLTGSYPYGSNPETKSKTIPGSSSGSLSSASTESSQRSPSDSVPEVKNKPISIYDTRLRCLRNAMKKHNIAYYIVPQTDEHLNEYVSGKDKRLEYISGFTGSVGTALIGSSFNSAYIFVDGRFHDQVRMELDMKKWSIVNTNDHTISTFLKFLKDKNKQHQSGVKIGSGIDSESYHKLLPISIQNSISPDVLSDILSSSDSSDTNVGFDPKLISASEVEPDWISISTNLIDELRKNDSDTSHNLLQYSKISETDESLIVLPEEITGETYMSKRSRLMSLLDHTSIILTKPDEIGWLINLRGSDIKYCQTFKAFMIIHPDTTTLYINKLKLGRDVLSYLDSNNIIVKPYDVFYNDLKFMLKKKTVCDLDNVNYLVSHKIPKDQILSLPSPIITMKAIKNDVEIDGFKKCHILDAIANCKFFAWISMDENTTKVPTDISPIVRKKLNESDFAEYIDTYRKLSGEYLGQSFPTIIASGKNSAIVHYEPTKTNNSIISADMLLCDSGGHYTNGTTDITRTLHLGKPSKEQIMMYTAVLKGHIDLAMAKFPKGTSGAVLDSLARQYLWKLGKNYDHATGHGVGHRLNVHEHVPVIDVTADFYMSELKSGMIISNEPGYYSFGHFGIRIESLMVVIESPDNDEFLEFEQLTLVPMERKLIDVSAMNVSQRKWLNDYHKKCWDTLTVSLKNDDQTLTWLRHNCYPM